MLLRVSLLPGIDIDMHRPLLYYKYNKEEIMIIEIDFSSGEALYM